MSHPTVPFGQPGAPAPVVLAPNQPMPSWNGQQQMMQGQPPAQPQPQQQVPQPAQFAPAQPAQFHSQLPPAPQQQGQPQGFPFQQAAPIQQAQPNQPQQPRQFIHDNFVMDGENVPLELRGRTWGQIRQIYGTLADSAIRANPRMIAAPPPNQPGQPQQQQPQQPAQPRPQQPAQPQQTDEIRSFWENPGQFVRDAVQQGIAPVVQRSNVDAAREAQQIAVTQIPDYAQIAPALQQIVSGAPVELLQDVNFWLSSADLARGRMIREGNYNGQRQPAQPQFGQPPQQPANGYPPRQFGPGISVPAQHQFFTEQPTPPQGNGFSFGSGNPTSWELTPEQKMYAQKMGMTEQEYRDWSGGVVREPQRRAW